MKNFTKILTGANPKAGILSSLRLILGLFMALLLPLSQAANFAHVIKDDHACQYHGQTYSANGQHFNKQHTDLERHDHPADHSSEPGHHAVTDHLEVFHMWKPISKIALPPPVAVLAAQLEAFAIVPRPVNRARDEKQHWQSMLYGQPPQLRAPPPHS